MQAKRMSQHEYDGPKGCMTFWGEATRSSSSLYHPIRLRLLKSCPPHFFPALPPELLTIFSSKVNQSQLSRGLPLPLSGMREFPKFTAPLKKAFFSNVPNPVLDILTRGNIPSASTLSTPLKTLTFQSDQSSCSKLQQYKPNLLNSSSHIEPFVQESFQWAFPALSTMHMHHSINVDIKSLLSAPCVIPPALGKVALNLYSPYPCNESHCCIALPNYLYTHVLTFCV